MEILHDMQFEIADKIKKNYDCHIIMNNEEPYILFKLIDIGIILQLKNIHMIKFNNNESYKILTKIKGGMQKIVFITINGLFRIIHTSRKPIIIDFCKKIGMDNNILFYSKIEQETLYNIKNAFTNEIMIEQYKVGDYLIDLYFPEYNLCLECDEYQHNLKNNIKKDIIREKFIKDKLENCIFIRYKPYDKDYDIFNIINKIYKHIIVCKTK
jgi:very-short-patch-repair endonuclease